MYRGTGYFAWAGFHSKAIPYETYDHIQKIELRRQAKIKPDRLLNLAEALHLGSRATQFFWGIVGRQRCSIDPLDRRPAGDARRSHSNLLQLQTPAFILGGFGDIVVMNPSSLPVLYLEKSQLANLGLWKHSFAALAKLWVKLHLSSSGLKNTPGWLRGAANQGQVELFHKISFRSIPKLRTFLQQRIKKEK